jgi:glycosyltransferase involved in cell wall biosynthesis
MISFVIPAFNEEAVIGETIDSIHSAVEVTQRPYEIIAVDDASTDRTAEIARAKGARIVSVHKRQIAAVRNAGAKEAKGDVLIFVDADTVLPESTLLSALEAIDNGAVGGGSNVAMDNFATILGKVYFGIFLMIWKPMRLAAGCFVFARRDAYEAVGGFDERYFASEEIWLSKALKTQGKFVIVPEPVITSARKTRMYSHGRLFLIAARLLIQGQKAWQKREGLELWYDGQREPAPVASSSAAVESR